MRWLSGEGPEGISPEVLVRTITGVQAPDDADGAANVLAQWAEAAGRPGLPPVLLVDEVDGILPRFEPRFFERLRGMLGRVLLVLASRRELDRIYHDLGRTSPFANCLVLQWLGLLEPEAAAALIAPGAGLLGADDAERLQLWAGRHPFYAQLLGYRLVEARQHGEPTSLAMDRFQTEAAARLRELWRVLDEREQQALRDGMIGTKVERRSLRVRGLVTEDGALFGEVLRQWLREEA